MTTEAATAFAERLKTDEAFARKLAEAGSREERRALTREAGFELSEADLPAIKAAFGVEELSDEDLERVAGGMSDTAETVAVATGSAVLSAGAGIAVAAAF